ncbi:MAG: DUF1844 domain-containing protein [Kiritimatiellae bacterium]|nr:DUF1844 domain-containing protein [Kiritimatiellia bacterium]
MTEKATAEQIDEALFSHVVLMLAQNAAHMMGLLENPDGSTPEVQIEGAQMMIDMLEMLERKTEGRRSERESRFLAQTLTDLRMAFIQASSAPKPDQPAAAPGGPAEPQAASETPANIVTPGGGRAVKTEDKTSGGKDEEPPRFHKSYG